MPSATMDFDQFAAWVAERVGVDAATGVVTEDTPLASLDSLQVAELWIASEDLGLDLPEELFLSLTTIGDFFYYYERKSG